MTRHIFGSWRRVLLAVLPLVVACNAGDDLVDEGFVAETAEVSQSLACSTSRQGTMGEGEGPTCAGAYSAARIDARVQANKLCPNGMCDVVEARHDCLEVSGRRVAFYTMQFGCNL
ncbi:hypothetical protein LXT21_11095 [Myxococcus sp. K38C18041901]|uniref:hypothetical protein n=1 Tax=Myxococcus guangdongensis TaxID=2906760 RepID=UPI0020A7D48C|nr:hypothetical protein [Myxococcus guangdongensis]MCP3059319.1 hypothetical protein [Myxococcus guangdongensis]